MNLVTTWKQILRLVSQFVGTGLICYRTLFCWKRIFNRIQLLLKRCERLCTVENSKIQKEFDTYIGCISKSTCGTSDSFGLIASHMDCVCISILLLKTNHFKTFKPKYTNQTLKSIFELQFMFLPWLLQLSLFCVMSIWCADLGGPFLLAHKVFMCLIFRLDIKFIYMWVVNCRGWRQNISDPNSLIYQ